MPAVRSVPPPAAAAGRAILLTGFEPFGGETLNPSWDVARALHGASIGGARVHALRLPCVFGESLALLRGALADLRPALVVALGQAGGRCDITPERVAINVDDARIPDNAGAQPVDRPVVDGGPAAYFSTLPVKAVVAALRAAGIPASVSQTAGTFVCNHVFYGLMHALALAPAAAAGERTRGGFIHLPYLPAQAAAHPGAPSLAFATLVDGVRIAVETALAVRDDLVVAGGSTH